MVKNEASKNINKKMWLTSSRLYWWSIPTSCAYYKYRLIDSLHVKSVVLLLYIFEKPDLCFQICNNRVFGHLGAGKSKIHSPYSSDLVSTNSHRKYMALKLLYALLFSPANHWLCWPAIWCWAGIESINLSIFCWKQLPESSQSARQPKLAKSH